MVDSYHTNNRRESNSFDNEIWLHKSTTLFIILCALCSVCLFFSILIIPAVIYVQRVTVVLTKLLWYISLIVETLQFEYVDLHELKVEKCFLFLSLFCIDKSQPYWCKILQEFNEPFLYTSCPRWLNTKRMSPLKHYKCKFARLKQKSCSLTHPFPNWKGVHTLIIL